jgi:co-chaperonin GroES (HSP10)
VVSVGPGSRNGEGKHLTIDLNPGDIVYISRFVVESVEIDGVEHGLVLENDVLAKVKK